MIKKFTPIVWFVILLVIAATLALALPPNPSELNVFHISPIVYRAAILTLVLPYAVIWFSAFYAFEKLDLYAKKLHSSVKESEAFRYITWGVGIMAWGLAVPTILSLILNGVAARYPGFDTTRVIINNYIALLVPIIGFTVINKGTRQLTDLVHARPTRIGTQVFVLIYTVVSTFFVFTVLENHHEFNNPYHLSTVPLLLTLVIPYIWAWCIGLLSAYELWVYGRKANGVLYRQALAQLSGGIALVIAAAITVQYLTSTYANHTNISLSSWLIVIYCLLGLQASGYALIALGSKRLRRIEEV